MKKRTAATTLTCALIVGAACTKLLLPGHTVSESEASNAPDSIELTGTIRDFRSTHPDFDVYPHGGYGHYAGNVQVDLGDSRTPLLQAGNIMETFTTDYELVARWPFDEGTGNIANDETGENDGALRNGPTWVEGRHNGGLRFDGQNDNIAVPVHSSLRITGDTTVAGWFKLDEDFNKHSKSQVIMTRNKDQNHQFHVVLAGTDYKRGHRWRLRQPSLRLAGRLVFKIESGDKARYTYSTVHPLNADEWYHFAIVMNTSDSRTNKTFINGVDVTQDAYCSKDNQIHQDMNWTGPLYIGGGDVESTNLSGPRYFDGVLDEVMFFNRALTTSDFEDRPAGYRVDSPFRDAAGHRIAPHVYELGSVSVCGTPTNDTAGVAGDPGSGGITDANTFDQWFKTQLGLNMTTAHSITLTNIGGGIYEYTDLEFYPIDDEMLGNEGAHNFYFTYDIGAAFTYNECEGQFVRFDGSDDCWIFIDGKLAVDLGGMVANTEQRIDLDRLGLINGETYQIDIFFAQRQNNQSRFSLRTNLQLTTSVPPTVTEGYD